MIVPPVDRIVLDYLGIVQYYPPSVAEVSWAMALWVFCCPNILPPSLR